VRDQLWVPNTVAEPMRRQMVVEFQPFAWRPTLWKARVLHFQGHEKGDVDALAADKDEVVNDHREAIGLYTSPQVRPPDRVLNALASEPKKVIYSAAKDSASYWVGLLLFDEGQFASVENWLGDPRLVGAAGGPWANGTRYNLARTYEAEGKVDDAIKLYESDTSPQRDGNRLRAQWLQQKPQPAPPANEKPGG
jgi:Tetratricopeptide repeat